MDVRFGTSDISSWNMRADTQVTRLIQTGLGTAEFGILYFQHRFERAVALGAILFSPVGVGLSTDMRLGWAHELPLDSGMFGDVTAAGWQVLLYMPNLTYIHGPELSHAPIRVVEEA